MDSWIPNLFKGIIHYYYYLFNSQIVLVLTNENSLNLAIMSPAYFKHFLTFFDNTFILYFLTPAWN